MKIRTFTENDLEQVKEISKCSFSLTPFHVDDFFTHQQADNIVWEQWTRPAVDKGKQHCFVADLSGEIAGFIIYGGYKPIHDALGKKVASIILLAVKEKFRNSTYKVGSRLVEYAVEFFRKNNVFLVTVGTDLPNLPALHVYEKNGFRRILQWSTFRYYNNPSSSAHPVFPSEKIQIVTEQPHKGHEIFFHPISFLRDKDFSEKEYKLIKNVYDRSVENELKTGKLFSLYFKDTDSHVIIEKENDLSELTGKNIVRINRILSPDTELLPIILNDLIEYLQASEPGFMLECYVEQGKTAIVETLNSLSFRNVHSTITLHLTLQN